ncbi:hypothetical protein [Salmonella phage SP1]|uniref:RecA protein n=3 Tax=Kuttervirus TaxID=2169536 RepID=A0A6G6XRA8_9CAUD|nr:DNA repair protein [Salmonella phage SP1]YP_009880227.1 DNA repair protein [Escherichia phage EP75]ASZ77598.1 hypothetical protein [Salmonella phage SP1]AVZ44962.1 putative RecA-like recombination protein [Escherichia phage EP75]QIG60461.1 RecA protein [Salmonella phage Chennai]
MADSLMARMLKTAKKLDPNAEVLSKTDALKPDIICSTGIPILNLAWSGRIDGGLISGIKQLVGDSRTFKTMFGLVDVKAYMDKFPDAICIFADSEGGANENYWTSMGIDMDRVLYLPIENVEKTKIKLTQLLNDAQKGDKIIVFIDSISQLPSTKEVDDAIAGKDTQDMTRARALNSFWRVITPLVTEKKFVLVWINSYYDEIGNQYAEPNIKGGKQGFLSSNQLWFITRAQVKEDKDLLGWQFTVNIMKGRFVREKAKFPVTVLYEGGIDRWSGMLEIARMLGYVDLVSGSWYQRTAKGGFDPEKEKKYRKAELGDDFWYPLLENPDFVDDVNNMFGISQSSVMPADMLERLDNVIKTTE